MVEGRHVDLRWLPLGGVRVLDDGLLGEYERVRGKKEQRGCHGEDFHRVPICLLEIKIIFQNYKPADGGFGVLGFWGFGDFDNFGYVW